MASATATPLNCLLVRTPILRSLKVRRTEVRSLLVATVAYAWSAIVNLSEFGFQAAQLPLRMRISGGQLRFRVKEAAFKEILEERCKARRLATAIYFPVLGTMNRSSILYLMAHNVMTIDCK